jgi:DNA-binding NarL/FixJ family response regulator
MTGPIRVIIVDSSWWSREATMRVLERDPRFEPVAATDVETGRTLVTDAQPQVVIVDLDAEGGAAFLEELRERDVPAIAWGTELSNENLIAALGAGASYMLKSELDPERLYQLLASVASGDALLSQATRRILSDLVRRGREAPERKYALTPREEEVLGHIARGKTNAEIARELHLAPSSVKKLVSRLLQRLAVRNRTEAALLAQLEGLGLEHPVEDEERRDRERVAAG